MGSLKIRKGNHLNGADLEWQPFSIQRGTERLYHGQGRYTRMRGMRKCLEKPRPLKFPSTTLFSMTTIAMIHNEPLITAKQ